MSNLENTLVRAESYTYVPNVDFVNSFLDVKLTELFTIYLWLSDPRIDRSSDFESDRLTPGFGDEVSDRLLYPGRQ